ncbi:MAG: hypothetical protein LKI53_07365 [Bacteroidales bacterium]|jgi:hypothetical protein|nr:hypothetical protein [Bacteroidales bacterium]
MKKVLVLIFAALLAFSCVNRKTQIQSVSLTPIMNKALNEPSSFYYAGFKSYPTNLKNLPIGISASSLDGLNLLEAFLTADNFDNITGAEKSDGILDFAGEEFTFFYDGANAPYELYVPNGKKDLLKELVVKDAIFLAGSRYSKDPSDKERKGVKSPVKVIIMAGNTSAAYGYHDVKTLMEQSGTGVKTISPVDAASYALAAKLKWNLSSETDTVGIGILSAKDTLFKNELTLKIDSYLRAEGSLGKLFIEDVDASGLVEAMEKNINYIDTASKAPRRNYMGPHIGSGEMDIRLNLMRVYGFDYKLYHILFQKERDSVKNVQINSVKNYAKFYLISLIEKYRETGFNRPLKYIVLGDSELRGIVDTLYDAVSDLRDYRYHGEPIYNEVLAKDLQFVSPSEFAAKECYRILRGGHNLALRTTDYSLKAFVSFPAYGLDPSCVDENGHFTSGYKYGRDFGTEEVSYLNVPFSSAYIKTDSLGIYSQYAPVAYKLITKNNNR